jgi:hypothetical protein
VQAAISNHRKLRRSRAGVVSVAAKASPGAGQVCDEKTNVCEPLLTHRNVYDGIGTGEVHGPGSTARLLAGRESGGCLRVGLVVPGV